MKMSSWQLTIQVQVLSFLRSNRSNLSFHPVWIHQDHLYQWLRLLSLKLPTGYRFVLIRPAPPRLRSHPAVDNIAATWWPPLRQVMAESRGSRAGHKLEELIHISKYWNSILKLKTIRNLQFITDDSYTYFCQTSRGFAHKESQWPKGSLENDIFPLSLATTERAGGKTQANKFTRTNG